MSRSRVNTGSDLTARVLVAIPAIAFAIFIISAGGWIFAVGAGLLGLVAIGELFDMYARVRPVRLAGFLGMAGLVVAAYLGDERQVMLALLACVPAMFVLSLLLPQGGPSTTARMSLTLLGIVWIGLPIAHAVMLRELPHGGAIILLILVATFVGDTGAYVGGKMFGTRPLAPAISPNKTVEGLLIGMLFALLGGWWMGQYHDWMNQGQILLLALTAAVMAPLGDLFESRVKRDAGAKDAGRLFGAHGGALDRLDAAFFTLVAGYYVWLAML
jgi:phosphatidate cytidylyltransferase